VGATSGCLERVKGGIPLDNGVPYLVRVPFTLSLANRCVFFWRLKRNMPTGCIRARAHTHTYTHTHSHTNTHTYTRTQLYVHRYVHRYIHTHKYIYSRTDTYMYIRMICISHAPHYKFSDFLPALTPCVYCASCQPNAQQMEQRNGCN